MTLQEVDFILWQFGAWVRSEADSLRYRSPLLAVMREMGALSMGGGTVAIGDDLAMRIDGYLSLLRKDQPDQVDAILAYYVVRHSYRSMAAALRCPYNEAAARHKAGLAALSACFLMEDGNNMGTLIA